MTIASDVFHGVPRFVGKAFRATKTPCILFLVLWLGGATVLTSIFTYAAYTQWSLPLELYTAIRLQPYLDRDPTLMTRIPEQYAQILQAMTPEHKMLAKRVGLVFQLYMWSSGGVFFWLAIRLFRFLKNWWTEANQ